MSRKKRNTGRQNKNASQSNIRRDKTNKALRTQASGQQNSRRFEAAVSPYNQSEAGNSDTSPNKEPPMLSQGPSASQRADKTIELSATSQSSAIRLATLGQTRLHNLGEYLKKKREGLQMTKRQAVDDFSNALTQLGRGDPGRDNDWINRVERSNQRLDPAELWALLMAYKCDEAEKIQVLSTYGFLDCFSPDPRHRQIMAIFGRVYFDIIANGMMFDALADLIDRDPDITLSPGDCLSILSSVVSLFDAPLPRDANTSKQSHMRRV